MTTLASEAQLHAIDVFFGAPPEGPFTLELATYVLSVRDYVAAVADLCGEGGRPISLNVCRVVAAKMMDDDSFKRHVTAWNKSRFSRGTHHEAPRMTANRQFMRVLFELLKAHADLDAYLSV